MKEMSKKILMIVCAAIALAACKPVGNLDPDPNPDPVQPEQTIPDFNFSVLSIASGDIFFTVEPKESQTFWFSLQTASNFDAFASEEEVFASDAAYFQNVASSNGLTVQELLSGNLKSEKTEWRYRQMYPNQEYVIYMYGLSADGEVTTGLNTYRFKTTEVEKLDCSFTIMPTDIEAYSFKVDVFASNEYVAYWWDVLTEDEYQTYCNGTAAGVPQFMAQLVSQNILDLEAEYEYMYGQHISVTIPYMVERMSDYGHTNMEFGPEQQVEPSTDYYIVACGMSAIGTATTDAVVRKITTATAPANSFTFENTQIGADYAQIIINPTYLNQPFVALYERKEYFLDEKGQMYTDTRIINEVLTAYASKLDGMVYAEGGVYTEKSLIPSEDYLLLVFGYDNGEITTGLFKHEFRTSQAPFFSDINFILQVSDIKKDRIYALIQPSSEVSHYFNVIAVDEYNKRGASDDAIKSYTNDLVDAAWKDNTVTMDRKEFLSRRLVYDGSALYFEDLKPGTDYYIYAIGMMADGSFTTVPTKVKFTTAPEVVGPNITNIMVTSQYYDFYSGYYVNPWIYSDGTVSKMYVSILFDKTDVYNMTDEEAVAATKNSANVETDQKTYITNPDGKYFFQSNDNPSTTYSAAARVGQAGQTAYIVVVAFDKEGLYTVKKLTKKI